MDITSYSQLEEQLNKICELVIDNVSGLILRDLRNFIQKYTYESHSANRVYERSGEFENAWQWKEIQKVTKSLSKELFYNWQEMSVDRMTYKHIDYLSERDNREYLASILNINGLEEGNPIAVFRWSFWNNFIVEMTLSGTALSYFDSEFGKFNIKR